MSRDLIALDERLVRFGSGSHDLTTGVLLPGCFIKGL